MLELYYWSTPNGHKVTIFLEEAEVEYRINPINIGTGEQFQPDFLKIAPNNRIPALLDPNPAAAGEPIAMFESGAILLYLGAKYDRFLPSDVRRQTEVVKWLMWQMGGLGPMCGQNHHFKMFAPENIPYAIERYVRETNRLYGVLDRQLQGRDFIANDYSLADMACYPWIKNYANQGQNLDDFPDLKRWFQHLQERPAIARAYEKGTLICQAHAGEQDQ